MGLKPLEVLSGETGDFLPLGLFQEREQEGRREEKKGVAYVVIVCPKGKNVPQACTDGGQSAGKNTQAVVKLLRNRGFSTNYQYNESAIKIPADPGMEKNIQEVKKKKGLGPLGDSVLLWEEECWGGTKSTEALKL